MKLTNISHGQNYKKTHPFWVRVTNLFASFLLSVHQLCSFLNLCCSFFRASISCSIFSNFSIIGTNASWSIFLRRSLFSVSNLVHSFFFVPPFFIIRNFFMWFSEQNHIKRMISLFMTKLWQLKRKRKGAKWIWNAKLFQ